MMIKQKLREIFILRKPFNEVFNLERWNWLSLISAVLLIGLALWLHQVYGEVTTQSDSPPKTFAEKWPLITLRYGSFLVVSKWASKKSWSFVANVWALAIGILIPAFCLYGICLSYYDHGRNGLFIAPTGVMLILCWYLIYLVSRLVFLSYDRERPLRAFVYHLIIFFFANAGIDLF